MDDAGIVHENVEIAERAASLCDGFLRARRVADVGRDEARVAEGASGGLARSNFDIGNGDARALVDVVPGDREPNAARAASHDRNLVLEPHVGLRKLIEGSTPTARVAGPERGAANPRRAKRGEGKNSLRSTLTRPNARDQRRPNSRSRNQPSRLRSIG